MLINHLVKAGLTGAFGGAVFVAALLFTDALGLGSMMMASHLGVIAFVVLGISVMLTFASLAMGVSVMTISWDWDGIENIDHGQKGDSDKPM